MKTLSFLLFIFIFICSVSLSKAIDVSVTDFGARGDGKPDDRLAAHAAMDVMNKAGRGVVNFPEDARSYASLSKSTLTLDNGSIKRVIQLDTGKYDIVSNSLILKQGKEEFLIRGS